MLSGAIAGLVSGRMHLGLTVFTRGVGVGSVLGAAVSAVSFTSEGRYRTRTHARARYYYSSGLLS